MKAISNQNPTLNNIHSTLSHCINSRNYVYLSANKIIRQKGHFFLLIEKISSLIWTPKVKNDYSLNNVIEKTTLDVDNALKDPTSFNIKDNDNVLEGYKNLKQTLKHISQDIESLHERYKLGRLTSWRDSFYYLVPTLGGSWEDLSTWVNLVLSVPKGIKKIFSFLKACIKTIYCWWSSSYNQRRLALEKDVEEAHQKLTSVIKTWTDKAEKLEKLINDLSPENLAKNDLLAALKYAQELSKQGFPTTLLDALLKEKGIRLPTLGSSSFNNVLICLSNPLFPEILAVPNEGSIEKLLSFVQDVQIDDVKRRFFLKVVVEKVIAGQFVVENQMIPDPLPKDLQGLLKLLADIQDNKDISKCIGKKKEPVVMPALSEINPQDVGYVENRGFNPNIRSLLACEGFVKLSSYNLEVYTKEVLNYVPSKIGLAPCKPKKGFIITISDKPQPRFWEDLINFANHKDVAHFYLSGQNPIPIPTMDIIDKVGFVNLLRKMHVTTPIYFPEEYGNADSLNLLKILCPTLTIKKEGNEDIEDYSKIKMEAARVLINESSQKIKLPRETTIDDMLWLNRQNNLWGSLTYVDLSLCQHLDESILGLEMCKPSLNSQLQVIFPKNLKPKENLNLALEPITNDPVILREWLMKEENAVWMPHCLKLYSGIWEYASVFMIPAALERHLKDSSCPKEWTNLDPCSVSLWMYKDGYKHMPDNEIIEINAYHNGRIHNDNVEEFLDKFPKAQKVCLTGTAVTAIKVKALQQNEKYKNIQFFFEEDERSDPLYSLDTKTVLGEFKSAKVRHHLQTCHLFMETFCPEKIDNRNISVINFVNFEILLKKNKFDFNRFTIGEKNADLKELLSLGGDFCFQERVTYSLETSMSDNIFQVLKFYLETGHIRLLELGKGAYAYISHVDEIELLFFFALEMKLKKLAKGVLDSLPDIIKTIKNIKNNKQVATKKTLVLLSKICTKAYDEKFYTESDLLLETYLSVCPNDVNKINVIKSDLAQLKSIESEKK